MPRPRSEMRRIREVLRPPTFAERNQHHCSGPSAITVDSQIQRKMSHVPRRCAAPHLDPLPAAAGRGGDARGFASVTKNISTVLEINMEFFAGMHQGRSAAGVINLPLAQPSPCGVTSNGGENIRHQDVTMRGSSPSLRPSRLELRELDCW